MATESYTGLVTGTMQNGITLLLSVALVFLLHLFKQLEVSDLVLIQNVEIQ